MKVLKIISAVILLLVIFVGVSVYISATNINQIVKTVIEDVGSEALKTKVTLASADVSLSDGRVQLSGLSIANPSPFNADYILQMNNIVLDIELASLLDRIVEIKELTIDGARVIVEQKATAINMQTLMDSLDSGGVSSSTSGAGEAEADTDILIKLGVFRFENSSSTFISDSLGEKELSVPAVVLKNVGGDTGLAPEAFARALLKPVIKQINNSVKDKIKDVVKSKVKDKLKGKEDEMKAKLLKSFQ